MGDTGRICSISQVAGLLHLLQHAVSCPVPCLSVLYAKAGSCTWLSVWVICSLPWLCLVDACLAFFTQTIVWQSVTEYAWLETLSGDGDPAEFTLKFKVTPYSPVPSAGKGRRCSLEGLVFIPDLILYIKQLCKTSFVFIPDHFQCCHYVPDLWRVSERGRIDFFYLWKTSEPFHCSLSCSSRMSHLSSFPKAVLVHEDQGNWPSTPLCMKYQCRWLTSSSVSITIANAKPIIAKSFRELLRPSPAVEKAGFLKGQHPIKKDCCLTMLQETWIFQSVLFYPSKNRFFHQSRSPCT